NELNDSEKEAFEKLDDFEINQAIIENAGYFKVSNFSEIDNFETFKKRYNSHKKPVKKLQWLNPLLKIASVLVIAFGLYFILFQNNITQVKTAAGEKITLALPDESQVVLNALSSIQYNPKKWNKKRSLSLDGEAYFKVAKGEKFDVVTENGVVTVVGTQFNVKNRPNFFEVKCFEGSVSVVSDTIKRLLHPGQTYRITNHKFSEGTTASATPKWTANMSDFESVPFKEVLAEMERQYNIKIINKNVNVDRLFTGGFVHHDLENALISITQPMNMTYELSSSNQVIIRGKNN
ncbi:MAG: FecR family protein, partial [Aequorivita sp.]|nr:FecR family protein [Aequorivita sp.]